MDWALVTYGLGSTVSSILDIGTGGCPYQLRACIHFCPSHGEGGSLVVKYANETLVPYVLAAVVKLDDLHRQTGLSFTWRQVRRIFTLPWSHLRPIQDTSCRSQRTALSMFTHTHEYLQIPHSHSLLCRRSFNPRVSYKARLTPTYDLQSVSPTRDRWSCFVVISVHISTSKNSGRSTHTM